MLGGAFFLRERRFQGNGFDLLTWQHPFYRFCISTPYRDRLALIWHDEPREISVEEYRKTIRGFPVLLKDIGHTTPGLPPPDASGVLQAYTNSNVSLDCDIFGNMNYTARKNWRRANETYELTIAINPSDCFAEFYELYLATRRRLGVIPYPRTFFRLLFAGMGQGIVLFRSQYQGITTGFLLCYLHGTEMISAHIAYAEASKHMRVTDFLYINAFLWGQRKGYCTYRFGGDYNNQASLRTAKMKLGAVPWQQYDFASDAYRAPVHDDRPDSMVRRTLRSMPMAVYRHSGLLVHAYYA